VLTEVEHIFSTADPLQDEEGSGTMSSMSEGGGMHDDEGIWVRQADSGRADRQVDEDDGDEIMDDDDDGETDSHGQEVVIGDPEMGDDDQWDEENDEDGHGDELSQIGHLAENVFQGEGERYWCKRIFKS
jgi:hypothetical protein